MANTTVNIDIQVQSKTLVQLENELAAINAELKEVAIGSERFEELSKQAQKASKQLEQVNQKIEGFTLDKKIQAADGSIKILGGSLAGVVGVLGTLGVETEAFGEFERKAASAIAVAVGIKDVSEGFGQLRIALQGVTAAQLKANAAALANPYVAVGAAVAGLTLAFAKYVSKSTDDVVPTTTVLKNMFLSLGNATAFATRMAESYGEALVELKRQEDALQMDRAIQVLQAFGEETIDLEIDKQERLLKTMEEGTKEYDDELTKLLVLRAQRAKSEGEKQATAYEEARQKKLEELQFKWAAEEFADQMYLEFAEDQGEELATAFMNMFNKTAKEEFDPSSIFYIDPDDSELEEDLFGEGGIITKFQNGLKEAIDKTLANRQTWDNFLSVANQAFDTITDLSQQRFDREMINLDRQRSTIESNIYLSETERIAALERIEQKEKQAEIRRIKAERDQFTLKQTLLIAEEVMKAKSYAMEQIQIAKLNVAKAQATAQEIALAGVAATGKAAMSLGAFVAALGPFGIAAFAVSIGGIIASIVAARKKAKAQIDALGVPSGGGGAPTSSFTSPSQPSMQQPTSQVPQFQNIQPTMKAYVLSGDVTSAQEADAKLNRKRTIAGG